MQRTRGGAVWLWMSSLASQPLVNPARLVYRCLAQPINSLLQPSSYLNYSNHRFQCRKSSRDC